MAIRWTWTCSAKHMADTPFIAVARIIKAHGLKGEVSVALSTDLPSFMLEGLTVWIVPPHVGIRDGRVESVRPGPKGPLVKISGVESIELAGQLRGHDLMVRSIDLPDEIADNFFDPIDLRVVTDTGRYLGIITEVIVTGANDVWVVSGGDAGQVLLPVIDDVVLEIDEDTDTITVHVLDGLIDEEGTS